VTDSSNPPFAREYVNLASPRLGAEVISASDEFFAPRERLIRDDDPVFIPDKYDDHGKWMDGWESRRLRNGGNDHCILRLGTRAIVRGVDIDTSHFTGNHPPFASLEGCLRDGDPDDGTEWTEIVPRRPIEADSHNFVEVNSDQRYNHLRLNIFPDGGVARLRVYGQPQCAWRIDDFTSVHELSSITNGGRIVGYNDAHYGRPWAMLLPGRGEHMGDGWETRRRREPGNDWIVVALGARGVIERIEIDTAHFKGNYPESCSVEAAAIGRNDEGLLLQDGFDWQDLLARQKLEMDHMHVFGEDMIVPIGPATHLRLSIYPDGGISRFRAFGKLVPDG
jgi:allantoicase